MARYPSSLIELAKRGAEVRLRELGREARTLLDLFPHLRDSYDPDELPIGFLLAEGAHRRAATALGAEAGAAARRRAARAKKSWAARRTGEQK